MIVYLGVSLDPESGIVLNAKGEPYKPAKRDGRIAAWSPVRKATYGAHCLIWEAVNGPIPRGLQINHINGDPSDNRICNLEVVTPKENIQHAIRTGLKPPLKGERNGQSKITEADVVRIRERYAAGESNTYQLGSEYGLSHMQISRIVRRKKWKHVA